MRPARNDRPARGGHSDASVRSNRTTSGPSSISRRSTL
jgi:hypothetical protein